MPIKDPDKRRAKNAAKMRRLRAAGRIKVDPEKEAERKRRWYEEQGGKEKLRAAALARKQRTRQQGLSAFIRKISES